MSRRIERYMRALENNTLDEYHKEREYHRIKEREYRRRKKQ
jgi:hypothetical protein